MVSIFSCWFINKSHSHSSCWLYIDPDIIPSILWNPKVHYRIHKCPPPVPIMNQLDPVHTPKSYFLKIHLNIILPSMPGSPRWSLSLRFPHQNHVYTSPLPHMRYMPQPSILFNFITWTILGEGYRSFSSSLCSFLHSPVTSSLLRPNILLSTLFSNNLMFLPQCAWQSFTPIQNNRKNYGSVYRNI